MKSKKINERKKRRKKKDIRYIVLSVLHELILFSRERTIIMAKKWQTKIKLEETRAEWDAQCKKQNKEDHEESRRKLQPARKPFDNGVRLTGSCMEKNAGLKRLLSIDGSHPYKDVPYESGDHTGRTEMQKYREFGVKKKRTVSIGESSNKAVLIEIPCSVLVPPPPPSLLLPPSNKFLSSISSSLAPSSILPSASASKGWSSRHERPRKEDPEMETEDSKMRREKEDETVPLASTLSSVLLNEEAPPSMIPSIIREDNKSIQPPSPQASIQFLESELPALSSVLSSTLLSTLPSSLATPLLVKSQPNESFDWNKDNNFTTNFDQPSAESSAALAPEPLPLLLPPSNESFDRKEDPEKEDEECRYTTSAAATTFGLSDDWNGHIEAPTQPTSPFSELLLSSNDWNIATSLSNSRKEADRDVRRTVISKCICHCVKLLYRTI